MKDEDRPLSELGDEKRSLEEQRESSDVLEDLQEKVTKVRKAKYDPENDPTKLAKQAKKLQKVVYSILVALFLAVIALFFLLPKDEEIVITNFEQCQDAGYPITKGDNLSCTTPDGDTFNKEVSIDDDTTEEPTEDPNIGLERLELVDGWASLESGLGGFNVKIPAGWNVTNVGDSDWIFAFDLEDITNTEGRRVTVVNVPYAGFDNSPRFQIIMFKEGFDYYFLDGDEEQQPITLGGMSGTKYTKTYPIQEQDEIGPYPGTKQISYEFRGVNGYNLLVVYNIFDSNEFTKTDIPADDPDQTLLIEQVVDSIVVSE